MSLAAPTDEAMSEISGFRVLQELGRSPKGTTYRARRLVEQDVVAVKMFRRRQCDREFLAALPKRAEASFFLDHRGIVRSLGCIADDKQFLLITEYAVGEPLARALHRKAVFSLPRALRIVVHAAKALRHAAAQKLFHGRLHPADIIVTEDETRILGVGLGEQPEHAMWASTEPYLFEPLVYAAPERMPGAPAAGGDHSAAAAADIYSLGAIMCHLVTGQPPFAGTDEAMLVAERRSLGSRILKQDALPPGSGPVPASVVELINAMLAPDARRPSYDEVIYRIDAELAAAERAESASAAAAAKPPASAKKLPGDVAGVYAPVKAKASHAAAPSVPARAHEGAGTHGTGGAGVPARHAAAAAVSPPTPAPAMAEPTVFARVYTAFLVGATALIFIAIFGLTLYLFVFDSLRRPAPAAAASGGEEPAAPPGSPNAASPSAPPDGKVPAPLPSAIAAPDGKQTAAATPIRAHEDSAGAARQFELIQEMLKKEEIQPTPTVLRLVKTIVEKAGPDTPTGVKAAVLAGEIEDTLLKQSGVRSGQPHAQVGPQPETRPEALPIIPGVGRAGSPLRPEVIPPPAETPESGATAKTATGTGGAPVAPIAPGATPPAGSDASATAKTGTEAGPTAAKAKTDPKLAANLRSVLSRARGFQYENLAIELKRLAESAEGPDKNLAEACAFLVRQEEDLFKHCRARLKEQIERHPRKESPLQVFPRKNDPNGDDIVDFDEHGLRLTVKKGPNAGQRTQSWEKVPTAQVFALLQLLTDKNSAEDQAALAAFAFTRELKDEQENALKAARALPGGAEKTGALEKAIQEMARLSE